MGMDIRTPIGGLFTILGLMLVVFGVMTHGNEMYTKSLGFNINIWWGLVMTVFGVVMLFFSLKGGKNLQADTKDTSEQNEKDKVSVGH
jgi:membrane-bound ClpP family serine protease